MFVTYNKKNSNLLSNGVYRLHTNTVTEVIEANSAEETKSVCVGINLIVTKTNYEFIFHIPCQTQPDKNENARDSLTSSSQST